MEEYLNANEKVPYALFRSDIKSWDTLFTLAAEFATKVGREKLINISHSESRGEGVVTVWYGVLCVSELEGRAHRVWKPNSKVGQIALLVGCFTS